MLATCQVGYEALLARELAGVGWSESDKGPGWVAASGDSATVGRLDLAFAHLVLIDPREIRGETVNGLAQAALDAFSESLRGERIEAEWPQIWQAPAEITGLSRRAGAVQERFDELLRKKLSRVARLSRASLPRQAGPARGLFVWFGDFGRLWLARTALVNGQRRMADDPAAPSRSYLKVEEAYGLLGCEPQSGETVADLGAAPGGWSYSAARRGARVIAVDHGPLKAGALDHPGIEHRRADAFGFAPDAREDGSLTPSAAWRMPSGGRFDWLFCDLVEEPHHVLTGICRPWLENRWCRRFVINLKFGRVDPIAFLAELRAPESPFARAEFCRVRHLYHDREEFTVVGTVS